MNFQNLFILNCIFYEMSHSNLMPTILLLFKDSVIHVYPNMTLFSDLNKIEKKKSKTCLLFA